MDTGNPLPDVALVVEDDDQIAYLLRFILEREGYRVELANDGRAAMDLIGRIAPPALTMLDVMLPHADGYQLLGAIRAQEAWRGVPVLMLTAKSQEKDIVRALDSGADDYLVKPFKPEELRARIKRLVKGRKK
ncbi:MAG: response regulator transcription factor [Burkholderiales bacterium]|jgi:DNA-binding response OmpR family regulator|nr:response regulator transcription factor [Burkholderiales bacterium]